MTLQTKPARHLRFWMWFKGLPLRPRLKVVVVSLFKAPLEEWFPSDQRFDSWATRFGALAVIQLLSQASETKNLPYFATLTFVGTLILCVATLLPLWKHIKESSTSEIPDIAHLRASFGSVTLGLVTIGMALPWGNWTLNQVMSGKGALLLAGAILLVGSFCYLILRFREVKTP